MYKFIFIILTITALSIFNCSSDDNNISEDELHNLFTDAIAGNSEANLRLHGIFSNKHIGKTDYNSLAIKSMSINNKLFYSVLLEYNDPILNLFAIYDDQLNLYVLDKSLNGYLNAEWNDIGDRNFVFVQERFLTKDVLSLDRLSIYQVSANSADLVYRSLSRFVKENHISYNTVGRITDDFILTKVSDTNDKRINDQVDTFYFNSDLKKYLSKSNLFTKYVRQQINDFNWTLLKPEIPAEFLDTAAFSSHKVN